MTDEKIASTSKDLANQTKIFNISSYARGRLEAKRKRKGLGELKPRQNNPYIQFITYSTSICAAKTIFAPLDRVRILSQVRHMANVDPAERVSGSSLSMLSKIIKEQGFTTLWRGNNANIYRHLLLISCRVTLYDRIKHAYMPYDKSRYTGIDYYWRYVASAAMIMSTAACTYPFDLIHTRLASDMSKKGETRLYTTTFDCFNRTNIDEGRRALWKGIELSMASSTLRLALTLPLLDVLRS